MGLVVGHSFHNHQLSERSRSGLLVSAGCGALLYGSIAVANYATGLFR